MCTSQKLIGAAMRSTSTFLIVLMTIGLNACTQEHANLFRSSNAPRIYDDGQSVDVTNVEGEAEAQPFAKQYCDDLGKKAAFQRFELLSYHHVAIASASFKCE
jgi:hypothetical protein